MTQDDDRADVSLSRTYLIASRLQAEAALRSVRKAVASAPPERRAELEKLADRFRGDIETAQRMLRRLEASEKGRSGCS